MEDVQSLSHVWLFVTPWTAAHQASLSSTVSWSLLKLMSIESVMPSNYLLSHPLPPSSPFAFNLWKILFHESLKHLSRAQGWPWVSAWGRVLSLDRLIWVSGILRLVRDWVPDSFWRVLRNMGKTQSTEYVRKAGGRGGPGEGPGILQVVSTSFIKW